MSLPDFYQITPEPVGSPHFETFFAELTDTLGSGIRLLQLRAKQLGPREHLDVARRTRDLCRQSGAILMLNGPIDMAREVGCDGVHLGSDALMSLRSRPVPDTVLLSAACHSAEQLEQAARMAVDFVTLCLPSFEHERIRMPTRSAGNASPNWLSVRASPCSPWGACIRTCSIKPSAPEPGASQRFPRPGAIDPPARDRPTRVDERPRAPRAYRFIR